MDGYMKLEYVGIEIYGCVDAFARKVKWVYVGLSARTQVSVVLQYLDHIKEEGFQPEILRSDFGSETPMLADAHYTLRRANDGLRDKSISRQLPYRNHGADADDAELRLEHCYYYGKSTRNLAVETWWAQLRKSTLEPWLVSESIGCSLYY